MPDRKFLSSCGVWGVAGVGGFVDGVDVIFILLLPLLLLLPYLHSDSSHTHGERCSQLDNP